MKTIMPAKLKIGDEIRIISPSFSGAYFSKDIINKSIVALTNLGFKVTLSDNFDEIDYRNSSSCESRVKDFMQAFADKNVKAVICVSGGFVANELLDYLDYDLIKENPKILIGNSDITVLLNSIFSKTGLITYLGPNLSYFASDVDEFTLRSFQDCLMKDSSFNLISSNLIIEKNAQKKLIARNTKSNQILNFVPVKGQVLAGNLCSFNLLQGTDYMPSLKNKILFIEEDCLCGKYTGFEFERNLESLLQQKDADSISGFLFGKFQKKSKVSLSFLKKILLNNLKLQNKLLIINADFGHTFPISTLPVGGNVDINLNPNLEILFNIF